MSLWSLTYQQSVFKCYHSDIHVHFSEFLTTRWWQKSTGIDIEQNYVTVTPCIMVDMDRKFFKALYSPAHCLHPLFSPVKSNPYGLRSREHNFQSCQSATSILDAAGGIMVPENDSNDLIDLCAVSLNWVWNLMIVTQTHLNTDDLIPTHKSHLLEWVNSNS